jgi:hypothetical protein
MEDNCKYVTIRGLKRLCNFKSDIYISDTQNGKEFLYNMVKSNNMFDGMSIFICSDLLDFFVNDILDKISNKFILISGMSIKTCPKEALHEKGFYKLITNNFLIRWCSQNNTIQYHPKIVQVPLGLDYHVVYTYKNVQKFSKMIDGTTPVEQEKYLIDVINNSKPFCERINKIYVNFDVNTDRFGQRNSCLKNIHPSLLEIYQQRLERTKTWTNTTKYAFVISPYGNGMDCHRHWEALILGSILIIKTKEFVKIFEDLPVLIVNDWKEINQKLLDDTIQIFKTRNFNYDKLTLDYWKKYFTAF